MSRLIITSPLVFGAQVAMALFFYRSRAVSHASWTESDWVVFGFPTLAGFAAFAFISFLSIPYESPATRTVVALGLSVTAAVISFFVGMLIAVNVYGT